MNPFHFIIFISFLIFSYGIYAQDLSGEWKTNTSNGFYAELHLIKDNGNNYSGHSYDEQGGGYCSYRLVGDFNNKRNIFNAKNTSVIQRSPEHRGSIYRLRYSNQGNYEYLKGTIEVESNSTIFFPGNLPQQANSLIQVTYYRVAKDPIVDYSKDKKEEDIYVAKEKNKVLSVPDPLEIPDPKDLTKDSIVIPSTQKEIVDYSVNLPIPEIIPEPTPELIPPPLPKQKPVLVDKEIKKEKQTEVEAIVVAKKPDAILKEDSLRVLKEKRINRVIKTFSSNGTKSITLKIRDYGTEDNDLISVFFNDELIIQNLEIKNKEEVYKIKIDPMIDNKFTFVANNLGRIPPNTCTVSFKVRRKTFHEKIFTDEKNNAIIMFKP